MEIALDVHVHAAMAPRRHTIRATSGLQCRLFLSLSVSEGPGSIVSCAKCSAGCWDLYHPAFEALLRWWYQWRLFQAVGIRDTSIRRSSPLYGNTYRIRRKLTVCTYFNASTGPHQQCYTVLYTIENRLHILHFTIYYTILYCTILYYTILYYTILYYTILYYTILYYTILYYTILYYTILYYTILYYTILYCTILYYTVLYYTILYYTILYYTILYYTILYYTILYYTILYYTILYYTILYYTILYYTILYYTILYYTILYYTILYYTILYYTILYYTICGFTAWAKTSFAADRGAASRPVQRSFFHRSQGALCRPPAKHGASGPGEAASIARRLAKSVKGLTWLEGGG